PRFLVSRGRFDVHAPTPLRGARFVTSSARPRSDADELGLVVVAVCVCDELGLLVAAAEQTGEALAGPEPLHRADLLGDPAEVGVPDERLDRLHLPPARAGLARTPVVDEREERRLRVGGQPL